MSIDTTSIALTYFGKLPSRGDFVKHGESHALLTSLDTWVARAMESMTEDVRWKNVYDQIKPFNFIFLGSKNKLVIGGHLAPTHDSASRRFPFVLACAMQVQDPDVFLERSPLVLSRVWNKMSKFAENAVNSLDATLELGELGSASLDIKLNIRDYESNIQDYLDMQTIGSLENQLKEAGFSGNCRQLILGLGLLLQPVMASGADRLEKTLCLPLPRDTIHQYLIAAFWMSLINPFLQRADFELTLYIVQMHGQPTLVVGFNGASSLTLRAVLNPISDEDHLISLEHAEWVEDSVNSDYGVKKLSSYLEQTRLSLDSVKKNFNEVFLGV